MKDTPRRAVSILESHLELPAPAWLNSPTEPSSTLTVFSFVPRCQGLWGVAEVDRQSSLDPQLRVLGHLASLVPGQRAP